MDVDGAIDRFRSPPLAGQYGEAMVSVLELCRGILMPLDIRWSTSHHFLLLSKPGDVRGIRVYIDSTMVEFTFQENWDDGLFFRMRQDRIRCAIENARPALIELLNRLSPAKA